MATQTCVQGIFLFFDKNSLRIIINYFLCVGKIRQLRNISEFHQGKIAVGNALKRQR